MRLSRSIDKSCAVGSEALARKRKSNKSGVHQVVSAGTMYKYKYCIAVLCMYLYHAFELTLLTEDLEPGYSLDFDSH